MKIAALFSGGKDSVYALYWAINQAWDARVLVNISPETQDSWMFHFPNSWITKLQSKSIGIPLITRRTTGKKEEELHDLELALNEAKKYNITGIISGALASEYQKTRIETVCHKLNLKSFSPLWHKNQIMLLKEMVRAGFEIVITSVSAYGMTKEWLGSRIDYEMIKKLEKMASKYGIWPAGEGGEFETLVLDGPIFKKRIIIDESKIHWEKDRGILEITSAHLA